MHVWTGQGFCYVKEAHKYRPSLTEVDWWGLKKETPKCRHSLTEVDSGGKIWTMGWSHLLAKEA